MDGLNLAVRFSYITNYLHFCGPESANQQFLDYLTATTNQKDVEDALRKFEGLYPYLKVIADKHGKHFTDYDVVEAYWIGNALLDGFTSDDLKALIRHLVQRGLPRKIGEQLITDMPSGFVPHHNFNVFYVGVGRTTGSVGMTLQNMDNCRISWGRVVEVLGDKLIVQTQPVMRMKKHYVLGQEETKTIVYRKDMMTPKPGDVVAIHWGFACVVLSPEQLKNLEKYTKKILDVMNSI